MQYLPSLQQRLSQRRRGRAVAVRGVVRLLTNRGRCSRRRRRNGRVQPQRLKR
jgi:hypothetical protein